MGCGGSNAQRSPAPAPEEPTRMPPTEPRSPPSVPEEPTSKPPSEPLEEQGAAAADERMGFFRECVAKAAEELVAMVESDELAERTGWALELGGDEFDDALSEDAALGGSPVRLVDARFLIALARAGGVLLRRQDLPDSAFIPLDRLQRMGDSSTLPIICVSHPWLQPDTPDPRGDNLRLLARVLAACVAEHEFSFGVFLDFVSLCQKGPAGEERTASEAALFGRALCGLSDWYSHPHTFVLKVTSLPRGYPEGYTFPAGITPNQAAYAERGWCFCESSLCCLTKASYMVFDLAALSDGTTDFFEMVRQCAMGAARAAPLTAADFSMQLDSKSFTSKKADLAVVNRLYSDGLATRVGAAKGLMFAGLGWGDGEVSSVARVLASGAAPSLEMLNLFNNQIGDEGAAALAEALRAAGPGLPIQRLFLNDNRIGGAGMAALAEAVRAGALPAITQLRLDGNLGDGALVEEALRDVQLAQAS